MNAINEEPEAQEIEALLPWYAAGKLSRRSLLGPRGIIYRLALFGLE
jgi:hypothetical protein